MDSTSGDKEKQIIDRILSVNSQRFLIDYFSNGLFGDDKNFTKGLNISDYDIILSTVDEEDNEIFHSLNICNTKFDPKTAPSRKIILFKDLEAIINPFVKGRYLAEKDFSEVTIHVYPKIRRNLRFNICSLTYKIVKNGPNGKKVVEDYKMEHEKDNPDKKDILCLCTFQFLYGSQFNEEKLSLLLQQFIALKEFWDSHRIVYIILCIEEEKYLLTSYEKLSDEIKSINETYSNVRLIFYVNPHGKDEKEILNIFVFNDFGREFYFHMNSDHVIYKADDLLCCKDIIENAINRKKQEKIDNERYKLLNKTKEQIIQERNEAFLTFFNFLKNIKQYKYNLYISFKFDICLRYNENSKLSINYIDFSHIMAELRTNEYRIIKQCADILKPDIADIQEIPVIDIDIDFLDKKCFKCSNTIKDNEDMYYCYICKVKYCRECVWNTFYFKKGKAKFIDPNHNILYFKTRDLNQFKNIDKYKLGLNLFTQCFNELQFVPHIVSCFGCKEIIGNSPRYICLNCRPGKVNTEDNEGFYDFCDYCVQEMMNRTKRGLEMQNCKEKLYNEKTRLLIGSKETYQHDNDSHIYLMIPLQLYVQKPYYVY